MFGLRVVRLEVLIAQWPCRRDAAMVRGFPEVLDTEPQQGRAIHLRVAADVILNAGRKRLAVLVIPRLFGPVLRLDKDSLGIPVVFLTRQVSAPFEHQNPFAGGRQMVRERTTASARTYDDDVVMVVRSQMFPNRSPVLTILKADLRRKARTSAQATASPHSWHRETPSTQKLPRQRKSWYCPHPARTRWPAPP